MNSYYRNDHSCLRVRRASFCAVRHGRLLLIPLKEENEKQGSHTPLLACSDNGSLLPGNQRRCCTSATSPVQPGQFLNDLHRDTLTWRHLYLADCGDPSLPAFASFSLILNKWFGKKKWKQQAEFEKSYIFVIGMFCKAHQAVLILLKMFFALY